MKIGLIGLPYVGKRTLFNILTGSLFPAGGGGEEQHIGAVRVPDSRLEAIAAVCGPNVVAEASITLVAIPGITAGDERRGRLLGAVREMDALAQVVRDFGDEDVSHVSGAVDPIRDIGDLNTEFMLEDLDGVEKRLEKLERELKRGRDEAREKEMAVLLRCRSELDAGRSLAGLDLPAEDEKMVRGFGFITLKPLLIIVNSGIDRPGGESVIGEVESAFPGARAVRVAGKFELELLDLSPEEARPFMDDLGMAVGARERVAGALLEAMALITFFTVNESELRAWLVRAGTTAPEAAGCVHTDMEKGFIKAEVIAFSDLLDAGSVQAAKAAGRYQLRGKDYVVRDGDIIYFRFSK